MMNRRGALAAMAAATCGAVSSSAAIARILRSPQGVTSAAASTLPNGALKDAVDERLRKDLARLAPREYSEEGIPVFLACEDLVTEKTTPNAARTLTPFNAALAADFRKNAEAWQRIHPEPPNADVAKIIEVLADRDFADGGKEYRQ